MTIRVSSKEILAKLMASENILVEHTNIPTAAFDLINRKLLLPNWKDISDDVYTLLISHEVGHALYTPTEEWNKEIFKTKDSALKQVVNIIEDVRIEKLIQQKYPGTVRAFRSGYNELEKINLFGTKDRDISSYGLLDRLNLHFKLGHFGYAKVPFADNELIWVDKISSCKSFSDVLKVAAELKKFVEENPDSQGEDRNAQSSEGVQSEDSTDSESQEINSDSTNEDESNRPRQQQSNKNLDSQSRSFSKSSSTENGFEDPSGSETPDVDENLEPNVKSETQEHFDSALQQLVDESISKTTYANFPKFELNKLIVPYKKVHEQISTYYSTYFAHIYSDVGVKVQQFKGTSKNVVNQLANIFEMKKKARLDVKALVSSTGKLDTNKVHSYRYNDDIFKKLTVVPQGKSHGLVMFIDMSSSMHDSLSGTFEQLLNLVLFCRRVGIPFDVYGFTDSYSSRGDMPNHSAQPGDLVFDHKFCLRHYFSSKMTGVEFNAALGNIICVMEHYSGRLYAGLPVQEQLNTTPLVPAIMCATEIVKQFRRENSLDIVNTIFLTDGEDTHGLLHNDNGVYAKSLITRYQRWHGEREKCFVRDTKTHKQWEIKNTTADMLNILRETTGVKVIGFHLVRKRDAQNIIARHVKESDREKQLNSYKNEKFSELTSVPGYDAYYLLPGGSGLNVSEDEFQSTLDTTVDWEDEKQAKKAMKAVQKDFSNFMKQKVTSRILLNRFIEHIS